MKSNVFGLKFIKFILIVNIGYHCASPANPNQGTGLESLSADAVNSANSANAPVNQNCTLTTISTSTITITWQPSRSTDVHSITGGGHKIYYDITSGVTKNSQNVVNVPNSVSTSSGSIGGLKSGCTYYVRVGAYSALNQTGGDLSPESAITIP